MTPDAQARWCRLTDEILTEALRIAALRGQVVEGERKILALQDERRRIGLLNG